MKITVLLENTRCSETLLCEHGLSLYIETGEKRILFDTGKTDAFARNADTLGIDLDGVDFCILSHGHYDHGGGLGCFLRRNGHAPVYLRREALGGQYNAAGKYIGLDPALADSGRLVFSEDVLEIAPGITLFGPQPTELPISSDGLTRLENGIQVPEVFPHEQYLLLEEDGKRVLLSGCSHRGIVNIAMSFQSDVLIGGFHFMNWDPEGKDRQNLAYAAETLLSLPTVYYTGHCTGQAQFNFLKERMGPRLHAITTGTVLHF